MRVIGLLSLVLLTACQSRGEALRVVCNAPNDCVECRNADPATRATLLAAYIDDHVSNGDVQELFAALAGADPATRRTLIRNAATEEGITECPILDVFTE